MAHEKRYRHEEVRPKAAKKAGWNCCTWIINDNTKLTKIPMMYLSKIKVKFIKKLKNLINRRKLRK